MTEAEVKKKNNEKAYAKTFHSPISKKVLADLAKFCCYNDSSVCEQSPDALQTIYNEGKRRVYLRILHFIEKGKA